MVNDLPFNRYLQLRYLLIKAKHDDIKEKFTLAAFVGFQMGAGGDKNFGQYLEGLGLGEEQSGVEAKPSSLTAKEAVTKAEGILAMARKKEK